MLDGSGIDVPFREKGALNLPAPPTIDVPLHLFPAPNVCVAKTASDLGES
jgi:hypothetical protein